jgi:hypothetical protein
MLTIEIEPTGVRSIRVSAADKLEQDLTLLVWPIIRGDLERLDRRLRREGGALLRRIAPDAKPSGGLH